MKVDRMLRVNAMIQRVLAEILEKDLKGYLPGLATITQVKTSPDLRECHVFVSVMGNDEEKQAVLDTLRDQRKHLQSRLSHTITIKYTPILHFRLDASIERGDRVFSILHDLHMDAPLPADGEPDDDGTAS